MGYFLAITCLLLLALLLGLLLTFFISLIRGLLKLRRVAWIAVRPEVVATLPEHLSPYLADFFAVAAPQLTRKGFVAVASGHTPRFSGRASRTHAVYVNPQTGERAGIIGVHEEELDYVLLQLVTDVTGCATVRTDLRRSTDPLGARGPRQLSPGHLDELCAAHARNVSATVAELLGAARDAPPPPPPPRFHLVVGNEMQWLLDRAASDAADAANRLGYVMHRRGKHYRPSWWAMLLAVGNQPWTRRRRGRIGFDVVLPESNHARSSVPDAAGAPTIASAQVAHGVQSHGQVSEI